MIIVMKYEKQLEFLDVQQQNGKLAHAYVLAGKDEVALMELAEALVKKIHCLVDNKGCSECQYCKLLGKKAHPDVLVVRSSQSKSSVENETDRLEIDVTQIRQVQNFLAYKPYYGIGKVVIIENAERMNTEAQNCFLKSLEEPKGATLLLLLTTRPDMLLPTIASRCQTIQCLGQAQQAQDFPQLIALTQATLAEKFNFAKTADLSGRNFSQILQHLQWYFRQVLLAKLGIGKEGSEAKEYTLEKAKHIVRLIESFQRQAMFSNINQKLALEVLLMEI